jgi:hypothetical protein
MQVVYWPSRFNCRVVTAMGVADVQPVSNSSYNFVVFAKRRREDIVLKIGVPNSELTSEIAALKFFFDGNETCQLLELDDERTHIATDFNIA